MTEQAIIKQIGKPAEIDFRKPKAIGSTGFYLKSFKAKNSELKNLKLNSKCNFEKRAGGLLLRVNYSNKLTAIPIPTENIIEITITKGKEKIDPFFLSPMWILLKLGVSKLYARYFKILISEYSIDQMELNLKTAEYEMDFIANGYLFERQLIFFENLNYGNKLKTIIKAST
ncbi:hypothetical protein [Mesoflavibacter sp. SCSIO 43206]|uniref:hypothetical protein n=1 Tax=Mesoflavibacter sp. SCSIO 43206 TaxID=2779362 RepID=UPI001CA81CCD|nr:hypothetical protein [Mesoflavibacter sp. SCSIO 43206]UAB75669.1 hypothetical protein INR78_01370 [Mesoflavibacter sp. SCSIO 43206]